MGSSNPVSKTPKISFLYPLHKKKTTHQGGFSFCSRSGVCASRPTEEVVGSKAKTTECCFCRSETAKRKEYAEPSVSEASRRRQTTMRRWRAMKNPTSATKKKTTHQGGFSFCSRSGVCASRPTEEVVGSKAKTTECCFCRSETAKRKEYAEPSVSEASRRRQTTMRRWRAMKNPTSATK